MDNSNDPLVIGKIVGAFGVKGWVKVQSFTEKPEQLFTYQPWLLSKGEHQQLVRCQTWQQHSKGLVALLETVIDRDAAQALSGAQITITRNQLPNLSDNEYYWADLEGLQVFTLNGQLLGTVDYLMETGANDVMMVKGERERCIPWLIDTVIKRVDLGEQRIDVDWDADF